MTVEKVDAWMPLWIGSYLADTMMLTRDQHGGYLLLLIAYWRNKGPLVDDDEELATITRSSASEWKKLKPKMAKFFEVGGGFWNHDRANRELAAATERRAEAAKKALKASEARWGKSPKTAPSDAPSIPHAVLGQCPTPSPTPLELELEGVNSKKEREGICDSLISEDFLNILKTRRPELSPAPVYAKFIAHYPVERQTVERWTEWVAREKVVTENPTADPDSKASVEALAKARGIGKWDELKESWAKYKNRVQGVPA